MAASACQKQYKGRGKKACMALAQLVRLNQVYGTAYPAQTNRLVSGLRRLTRRGRLAPGAYPVVEGLPALVVVTDVAGGLALAGEAIFGEVPTGLPPAPLRLTGAVLRGTNPADGGFTVLERQVTATGGTGAVAVHITIDHFVDGGTHPTGEAFRYALGTRYVAGVRQYRAEVVGQPTIFVTGAFTAK